MKKYYDIDTAIDALEKALATARNDAAGYADMGQTEDSIHADGVADGLAQALEIVRNAPDGHGIFF
jgi:predicted TPR repeat methyltransferase